MTYGTQAHKNDELARRHANAFLKHLHFAEWNAVYVAKRRELEGNPNWTKNKSAGRSATQKTKYAQQVEDTADTFVYWIKLADAPMHTAQLAQLMGLSRVTTLRYLGRLEREGVVERRTEGEWPHKTLWSVTNP